MEPLFIAVSTSCHAGPGLAGHPRCVRVGNGYDKTRLYIPISSKTTALLWYARHRSSEDAQVLRAEVIKVVPHPRRFLRFALEGVAYQYKVLPFGLSLVDAALSPLRQMGICILNYLDDWLILAQSEAVSTLHKTLLSHLCFLGLRVNFAKRILSPSQ